MVIKFMTFDFEDEYLNNHPGSPPYYGPGPSSSSSDSSPVCNGCLSRSSGPGLPVPVAHPSDADTSQGFSSPAQVQQSPNRGRNGNNFLLKLIYRRLRYRSNRGDESKSLHKSRDKQGTSTDQENGSNQGVESKLVLFDDCSWAFGLEDLLRAPAEVLWKKPHWREYACSEDLLTARAEMLWKESPRGSYASLEELLRASDEELGEGSHWSTTYKVSLEDSTTVVVKRLKKVGNVTMTQLREHMELLGQIRHENVAPLRGYYISTDKSLMLYDYYSQGSAYSMLHGQKSSFDRERPRLLDWKERQKIVIGAARGIAYIHKQNGGELFHGNLTSFNVFVNSQEYGCISEICCNTLKSGESPYSCYNPNMREPSQASDIYGLGLLMLELLFGNDPLIKTTTGGKFWTAYHDQTDDIYDFDAGLPYGECMQMLNLALRCVMDGPDDSIPTIEELVQTVESNYLSS